MDKNISTNEKGVVRWQSPSNIALVKYWGKYGNQLPKNPSLSLTLKNSYSDTKVNYEYYKNQKKIGFSLKFESKTNIKFAMKVGKFLKNIRPLFKYLDNYNLAIESSNTFPHSAGIASSAAFYSSLALCLCSMEEKVLNKKRNQKAFYRKASDMARLGSGSASRSVYGGVVLWGKMKGIVNSSNKYAISLKGKQYNKLKNICDTILIVSSEEKKISSTIGHSLMQDNPYAKVRFKDATDNLARLLVGMKRNNRKDFISIVERDALSLHAMMMTSHPSFMLLEPNTISIINAVREYRGKTGANICFTLDAGPNVHLLYPKNEKNKVMKFIKSKLLKYCEKKRFIKDEVGDGPREMI